MPNLPTELIEDILRRLPVKSLKRFRAVAKSWCLLIDSEGFVKSHLRHSLVSICNRNLIFGGLGVYTVGLDPIGEAHAVKPPFYYKSVDGISKSCNGIVLVMSEPLVLWNPFSRDYKILPNCSVEYRTPVETYSKTAYGFGYDSRNDDYKVVRVVEFRNKTTHVWMGAETEVYGLKSNSWRRIEGLPYPLPFLRGNWRVHVNGAFHTLVQDPDSMDWARVMAFSLETEKHYPLMLPEAVRIRNVDVGLDVIGECLSVVCTNRYRVVIWVMKEYGVRESWTKLVSISPPAIERVDFLKPLVYSREGDKVLLSCSDKRLFWYDLRKKSVEDVLVDGLPFVFYAETCVESLVSLEGRGVIKSRELEKDKKKAKTRKKRDEFLSEGFKLVL